ncbi:MAG: hypothetical protein ACLFP6_05745 [Spirochaetaceae bacterium]
MLSEIKPVRQVPGEGFRRWFTDEEMDLIVWYDGEDQEQIEGFQLCYDKEVLERALTWRPGAGFTHHKVDGGESPYAAKMSPVLATDGSVDFKKVSSLFLKRAREIDQSLAAFVTDRLREHSG